MFRMLPLALVLTACAAGPACQSTRARAGLATDGQCVLGPMRKPGSVGSSQAPGSTMQAFLKAWATSSLWPWRPGKRHTTSTLAWPTWSCTLENALRLAIRPRFHCCKDLPIVPMPPRDIIFAAVLNYVSYFVTSESNDKGISNWRWIPTTDF